MVSSYIMIKQYKSNIMAAIHKIAEDPHAARVTLTETLWDFDALCLMLASSRESETVREAPSGTLFS